MISIVAPSLMRDDGGPPHMVLTCLLVGEPREFMLRRGGAERAVPVRGGSTCRETTNRKRSKEEGDTPCRQTLIIRGYLASIISSS